MKQPLPTIRRTHLEDLPGISEKLHRRICWFSAAFGGLIAYGILEEKTVEHSEVIWVVASFDESLLRTGKLHADNHFHIP